MTARKDQDSATSATTPEPDRGYLGVSPDPTPRENYTLAGVAKGLPTPETDGDAAAAARDPHQTR